MHPLHAAFTRKVRSSLPQTGAEPQRYTASPSAKDHANLAWFSMLLIIVLGCLPVASRSYCSQPGGSAREATSRSIPVASVNPLIGTGRGPGGSINLFPGPTMPFGLARLSPDTESHNFGYHYYQPDIQGFSMLHGSGPGWPSEGEVFFTATTGPVRTALTEFESPYSHSREKAAAGYYQVFLQRWGVNAELTATNHTGLARFTFPAGETANILVPISHTLNQAVAAEVHVEGSHEITGYVANWVQTPDHPYKVYFAMIFSRPFSSFGTWQGDKPEGPGEIAASGRSARQTHPGQWIGAYASWDSSPHSQTIVARIGVSFVDVAGAENNLKAEAAGKTFDEVRRAARAAWNKELSVIQVSGGSPSQRTIFYTALYHTMLSPCTFSDADGRYIGFDDKIHRVAPGHLIYSNYSGWDIYRSQIPLLALIEPQRMQDMAQSLVLMYQQGGWMGRRPLFNRFTNAMVGSPITIMLANAWLDGLHGFDIKAAWKGMLLDATKAPPPGRPYQGEIGIDWINKLHYIPNDKVDYGSVSQLQEDCIAYASLYDLAVKLGKTQDAKMLYQRALYYRNVFDPQDRFFRPRNADGQWTPDFDPAREHPEGRVFRQMRQIEPGRRKKVAQALRLMQDMPPYQRQQYLDSSEVQQNFSPQEQNILKIADRQMLPTGFIEGSAWHYQWLEPADIAWVIYAVGKDLFNQRLEKFFSYPTPGWYGQYYNPYNETDLEAPFEFNFSAMPWEAQRVVRRVLRENYTTSPNGVPGNDDCGEMSSWAVLTMMGIYTVDPASLAYELVSPVFRKVVIQLHAPYPGKTFTLEASANAEVKPYIQAVKLNGQAHHQNWIGFSDISSGGTLQFVLGSVPNKSWGSAPRDAPPSLSEQQP